MKSFAFLLLFIFHLGQNQEIFEPLDFHYEYMLEDFLILSRMQNLQDCQQKRLPISVFGIFRPKCDILLLQETMWHLYFEKTLEIGLRPDTHIFGTPDPPPPCNPSTSWWPKKDQVKALSTLFKTSAAANTSF